ncbi:MAG: PTS sugar transporter subunit IIB [Atopobium sp.]|jgi:PTS system cellobiose-specific IIB component|nr:PTS sugar transporter subunit IIB [Atopobium sp.]
MRKKIVLMCSQGASTSMLVSAMEKEAEATGYECDISATSVTHASEAGKNADIILLGPQVGYMKSEVEKEVACKVLVIPATQYGLMDGNAVLNLVKISLN